MSTVLSWDNFQVCLGIREEYEIVTRGRKYHGCGEEYNVEKGKGEAISSSLNIEAVGKNIKCGREEIKI